MCFGLHRSLCLLLPAPSLHICLLCQSEGPYTLHSATDQDSYIFPKCHFPSSSPDALTEEVFHVVTRACALLVVQHVGVESASEDVTLAEVITSFALCACH